jgi:hypothetical protein
VDAVSQAVIFFSSKTASSHRRPRMSLVTFWKEEGVVGGVVAACGCSVSWFSKHSKKEEGEVVVMGLFMLLEVDFLEWEEWSMVYRRSH